MRYAIPDKPGLFRMEAYPSDKYKVRPCKFTIIAPRSSFLTFDFQRIPCDFYSIYQL